MSTTTELSALTPVEVDTELARLYGEGLKLRHERATYEGYLKARYSWGSSKGELVYTGEDRARYEVKVAAIAKAQDELAEAMRPYYAEYNRRGGWARYYEVTNDNGHVHSSMVCSTCYATTEFEWLYWLADKPEADMIAEYGEKACTVCFEDAPTYPAFHAPGSRAKAATEAKAAEKAAKEAAKNAKLLVEPVRNHHGVTVRTVASAKQELRDAIWYKIVYSDSAVYHEYLEEIETMTAALLRKGIPQSEIDTIVERATKKARKEMGK